MGLGLEVGMLADLNENDEEGAGWFREDLAKVNAALAAAGLPLHVEPEKLTEDVFIADMFGHGGLHTLRRVAAWSALGKGLPPPGGDDAHKDPVVAEYYAQLETGSALPFEHVINHSDAEGWYLPQDFPRVLSGPELWPFGSTPRLLAECRELAQLLGLPEGLDSGSREVERATQKQGRGKGWQAYGVETYSCLQLIAGCEASLRTGAALVFC